MTSAVRYDLTAAGLVIAGTALLSAINPAFGLTVDTTNNANTLVNTILGEGVTIVGAPTYTGAAGASGTFAGGAASGIGIDKGIILTTGAAGDAVGPNKADNTSTDNGLPGDPKLNGLLPPGGSTFDATKLTFDFSTTTGDLFFSYVFASEEYNEFVNSEFNDVFGFFLDGVNIALVPGTKTPVAINNVNCGNPFNPPSGGPNCGRYNSNDPSDGTPGSNIEYDGFTDVFTATASGLAPGTHTIELAVADTSDRILDSAVFIQAGTFGGTQPPTPPTQIPEPATFLLVGTGLLGLGAMLRCRAMI